MINFIKYKNIFLLASVAIVIASIILISVFGFKQGIDFVGGSLWQAEFSSEVTSEDVREVLLEGGVDGISISKGGDGSFLMRFSEVSEERHQELVNILGSELGNFTELSFQSIGPSIGAELRKNAIWAVVFVLLGISLFVAFAFRKVSYPVNSWVYGLVALTTLFHDVIIPTGILAWLGQFRGVELDTNFVVALLVIAGFSIHDTIVVFDRIRENLVKFKDRKGLGEVVNISVNETLARSINTSVTLLFVLVTLFFAGPITLKYFVLTILIGTVIGTYSSIFIASPLLVVWYERNRKKR